MTTIAYKDGVIAYDSRCTQDITIVDDNYDKKIVVNSVCFFMSGSTSEYMDFVNAYFGEAVTKNIDCNALVVDDGRVFKCGVDKDKQFWKCPAHSPAAIGSGVDHALTAMDMGADAKQAVKMAMKRDTCTGGRIRTYKIKRQ